VLLAVFILICSGVNPHMVVVLVFTVWFLLYCVVFRPKHFADWPSSLARSNVCLRMTYSKILLRSESVEFFVFNINQISKGGDVQKEHYFRILLL
jgi:hypothetical protein